MARFNYLELPVRDVPGAKTFYAEAFGWQFVDYGPDYASTGTGDVDLGLDGDPGRELHMLPVIGVDDLEDVLEKVVVAGGTVTVPIFSFPGGRRFHFRDPAGYELAVWVQEEAAE